MKCHSFVITPANHASHGYEPNKWSTTRLATLLALSLVTRSLTPCTTRSAISHASFRATTFTTTGAHASGARRYTDRPVSASFSKSSAPRNNSPSEPPPPPDPPDPSRTSRYESIASRKSLTSVTLNDAPDGDITYSTASLTCLTASSSSSLIPGPNKTALAPAARPAAVSVALQPPNGVDPGALLPPSLLPPPEDTYALSSRRTRCQRTEVPHGSNTSLRNMSLISGSLSASNCAKTYGYARSITLNSLSMPVAVPSSAASARRIRAK
mmetsp:Transcript_12363/g.57174  ORF Transcript_12363/g.57174 Transcript_12363/m.57174 type:complete len:269 (+) Transcript_12363:2-808(+)